mgnify:CR=1 FL=1
MSSIQAIIASLTGILAAILIGFYAWAVFKIAKDTGSSGGGGGGGRGGGGGGDDFNGKAYVNVSIGYGIGLGLILAGGALITLLAGVVQEVIGS